MSTPYNPGEYHQPILPPSYAPAPPVPPEKGFFGSLFDVNFNNFIAPKLVKLIYILLMVMIGLGALVTVVATLSASPAAGVFMLIIAPILGLLLLMFYRVTLELMMVIFKISEDLRAMRSSGGMPR